MSLPAFLLVTGFVYILFLGGLALLRREGLSGQLALEAIAITILVSGVTYLTNIQIHPVLLLVLLYLVTMRARLLVDVGNLFAVRQQFPQAEKCYQLALFLRPDRTSRAIIRINQGTYCIHKGDFDQAIQILKDVLEKKAEGHLGVKYEAAAHFNLAVAYRRKSMETQAIIEFNTVIDTWPTSEYARRAEKALSEKR